MFLFDFEEASWLLKKTKKGKFTADELRTYAVGLYANLTKNLYENPELPNNGVLELGINNIILTLEYEDKVPKRGSLQLVLVAAAST